MNSASFYSKAASTLVLGLLPLAIAHGGDSHGEVHDMDVPKDDSEYPETYFSHPGHVGVIYAHIALMTLAWIFALPVAVVLSLARSRYTLIVQFVFLCMNALGLLLGTVYNAQTPDLYPDNAHHKIGWIITWVISAQILVSTVGWIAGAFKGDKSRKESVRQAFIPLPTEMTPRSEYGFHGHVDDTALSNPYRISRDSGHGTEPNTESLRSNSVSSSRGIDSVPLQSPQKEYEDEDDDDLEAILFSPSNRKSALVSQAARVVTSRVWGYLDIGYRITDRIILPFGFIAYTTGIATFGRFFEGDLIFNGLAHWIKGGVFFWLGLFTLGRWSGSFGESGWAWNVRPKQSKQRWRPSAEFVESALIFIYGSTNIFLEHLEGWGGEWTSRDMEHISITVLFIGGGLCGMLVESGRIREFLNTAVVDVKSDDRYADEQVATLQPPKTYEFSLNPIPALVILLLGIMMSSHTQASMISSMIHKQWGNLLLGASFARGLTYVLVYLKPPKSVFPSRPPTELLASFGLISGGIIFMASSEDTVNGMIHYGLDAMFMYTVTMGLVGLLMAWEVVVLAIKGWAIRRERQAT